MDDKKNEMITGGKEEKEEEMKGKRPREKDQEEIVAEKMKI